MRVVVIERERVGGRVPVGGRVGVTEADPRVREWDLEGVSVRERVRVAESLVGDRVRVMVRVTLLDIVGR